MTGDKGDKSDTSQKGHGSYLLMTGDNPGNLITHVQLKGVNYEEWAMAMRTVLRAKKKIGFIYGTIKEPATGSTDVEEEQLKNISRDRDVRSDAIAFVARQNSKRGHTSDKEKALCGNCGKHGHETNGCFDIIGYPEWYIEKYGSDKTRGKGNIVRGKNVAGGSSSKGKEQPPRANAAMISSTSAYDSKTSEPSFIPNLSTEDWAAIMNLVKSSKSGHNEKLSYIVPIPVELPLDIETFAVKKGTMRLTNNTFLSNVLFVPKIQCTLISIKCLMKDLNFSVNFIDGKCLIQDRVTRTMIGTGEEQGGVFLFKETEQGYANRVKVDDDFELWHRRLGHPLENKVLLIPTVRAKTKMVEKPCDVCFKNVAKPPILSNTSGGNVGSVDPTENHKQMNDSRMQEHEYGRGKRTRQPSILLKDFVTHFARCSSSKDPAPAVIDALESNGTWELVTLPPGKKAIDCKWVYKTKYNRDDTVERHKARLVIYENKQREGIDYKETFAPVAKMVTVRTFLSVAAVKNWELHQMDVHNAFLHGDLNEDVYMRLPPGFVARDKIKEFKAYLSECFHMKDLGSLRYFLGLEIARSKEGIYLYQRKYALDIIAESGLLGCKLASFSMDENHNLALATRPLLKEPEKYRHLVRRMIYLTISRPELSYCVHILDQFMKTPLEVHWEAALRVKYLKGNPGQGVLLSSNSNLFVSAYCDSDWARCPLTRRSVIEYFVMLGQSPISWKTKKQHTVSRSSAEAEYRSMATTICELKWLKGLLH
ncbi:retrovirus-related pol polyprotein from transposon RE2 [Tanacetum coccineum]